MQKFLAIDYGTKRIGLAVNIASLVEPLIVIDNCLDNNQTIASQAALAQIKEICQTEHIETIVLGISEAAMADKIVVFAKLLEKEINLPVKLMDETLSSYEVAQKMKEAGLSLKKRQGPIDHYSAAIILENFLETHVP